MSFLIAAALLSRDKEIRADNRENSGLLNEFLLINNRERIEVKKGSSGRVTDLGLSRREKKGGMSEVSEMGY